MGWTMATASRPWSVGVAAVTLLLGCGPDDSADVAGDDTITGPEGECPELVWSDSDSAIPTLEVGSAADADVLPLYTRIDGNLAIRDAAGLVDLGFLACVTEIRGGLLILRNPDLVDLTGLGKLEAVNSPWPEYDYVVIRENPALQNVDGLAGVEHVGSLTIEDNGSLKSLDGLASFRSADTVSVTGNEVLETVGLRALESVGELLRIGAIDCPNWDPDTEPAPAPVAEGNPALVEIDGLDALADFNRLSISGNAGLTSLEKLSANLMGASGLIVDIELNESLHHEQVLEAGLPGSVNSCGNLEDPQACECDLIPGNP